MKNILSVLITVLLTGILGFSVFAYVDNKNNNIDNIDSQIESLNKEKKEDKVEEPKSEVSEDNITNDSNQEESEDNNQQQSNSSNTNVMANAKFNAEGQKQAAQKLVDDIHNGPYGSDPVVDNLLTTFFTKYHDQYSQMTPEETLPKASAQGGLLSVYILSAYKGDDTFSPESEFARGTSNVFYNNLMNEIDSNPMDVTEWGRTSTLYSAPLTTGYSLIITQTEDVVIDGDTKTMLAYNIVSSDDEGYWLTSEYFFN